MLERASGGFKEGGTLVLSIVARFCKLQLMCLKWIHAKYVVLHLILIGHTQRTAHGAE